MAHLRRWEGPQPWHMAMALEDSVEYVHRQLGALLPLWAWRSLVLCRQGSNDSCSPLMHHVDAIVTEKRKPALVTFLSYATVITCGVLRLAIRSLTTGPRWFTALTLWLYWHTVATD